MRVLNSASHRKDLCLSIYPKKIVHWGVVVLTAAQRARRELLVHTTHEYHTSWFIISYIQSLQIVYTFKPNLGANTLNMSTGTGNTIVEFCSEAIVVRV